MNRRTAILWAIGVGQLLVMAAALAAVDRTPQWIMFPCVAVLYSQFYLAGVWIASGRRSFLWRMVAVAACLTSLTWVPDEVITDMPAAVAALGPGIVATLALLLPARAFGFRLHDGAIESQPPNSCRFQFSLRSILECTAATAILCSLGALAHPGLAREIGNLGTGVALPLLLLHLLLAGICVAELAIVLAMRRPWIGFVPLLLAVLTVVGLAGAALGDMTAFLWPAVGVMLWLALSFLPLRLLGYRFGRCRTTDTESTATDAPKECPFQDQPDLAD